MTRPLAISAAVLLALGAPAAAQSARGHTPRPPTAPEELRLAPGALKLSASLAQNDSQTVKSGVTWRVFEERADERGKHRLVAQSEEAAPTLQLPDGVYVRPRRLWARRRHPPRGDGGQAHAERLVLNAGALKLVDKLGDLR